MYKRSTQTMYNLYALSSKGVISPTAVSLYLFYRLHTGTKITHRTASDSIGMEYKTVMKHSKVLERLGVIRRDLLGGRGGAHQVTVFELDLGWMLNHCALSLVFGPLYGPKNDDFLVHCTDQKMTLFGGNITTKKSPFFGALYGPKNNGMTDSKQKSSLYVVPLIPLKSKIVEGDKGEIPPSLSFDSDGTLITTSQGDNGYVIPTNGTSEKRVVEENELGEGTVDRVVQEVTLEGITYKIHKALLERDHRDDCVDLNPFVDSLKYHIWYSSTSILSSSNSPLESTSTSSSLEESEVHINNNNIYILGGGYEGPCTKIDLDRWTDFEIEIRDMWRPKGLSPARHHQWVTAKELKADEDWQQISTVMVRYFPEKLVAPSTIERRKVFRDLCEFFGKHKRVFNAYAKWYSEVIRPSKGFSWGLFMHSGVVDRFMQTQKTAEKARVRKETTSRWESPERVEKAKRKKAEIDAYLSTK